MNPLKTSQDLAFYPFILQKVLLEVWGIFEYSFICVLNLFYHTVHKYE